jgi:predicted porin
MTPNPRLPRYLMALMPLAVLSAGAHAQTSSMEIFGNVDLAVQSLSTSGKGTTQRMASGSNQPSRLGFRGIEDLGAGLQASFWLEVTLAAMSGTGGANNSNNQSSGASTAGGFQFDRRSTVSLSSPLGELRVGRDYSPIYWNISRADPYNANGIASSRNLVSAGAVSGVTFVRASNSIGYHLPKDLGGLYGQAMWATGNNPSTATNSEDGRFVSARLGFARDNWDVAAATGKTTYLTGNYGVRNVYAGYNFGAFKLTGLLNQSELKTAIAQTQKDALIGLVVPFKGDEFKASYVRSRLTSSSTGAGASLFTLGYVHNLSKRTAVYGHWAHINNRGGASYSNGAVAPAANGSTGGYEFGIRHFF